MRVHVQSQRASWFVPGLTATARHHGRQARPSELTARRQSRGSVPRGRQAQSPGRPRRARLGSAGVSACTGCVRAGDGPTLHLRVSPCSVVTRTSSSCASASWPVVAGNTKLPSFQLNTEAVKMWEYSYTFMSHPLTCFPYMLLLFLNIEYLELKNSVEFRLEDIFFSRIVVFF